MEPTIGHGHKPDDSFDGGDLDCGSGLLLLIREHLDPLDRGKLLEIRSTEISTDEDLPAWCRMTGNELVSWTKEGRQRSFLVCKGKLGETAPAEARREPAARVAPQPMATGPVLAIPPLAVMGLGSWPRPRWMLRAMHDRLERRVPEEEFQGTADDAVRLAVEAQLRAGVDVVTDGEQRRDSYASFVGALLENCQLIPLTDLLPYVDDPEHFAAELRALDVPAAEVRHPAVFGKIARRRPIAVGEVAFARSLTERAVKVALPGPYLLTRTMWLECVAERAYATREELATDIVRVLREELADLLAAGAALVQFDEPVLSEVVFSGGRTSRSFMCGALSEKGDAAPELAFARDLVNAVVAGFPRERIALHVCRGNWTADESVCLHGDYAALVPELARMKVGAYLLEMCTPRAGTLDALRALPADSRIGVGVVNQKHARIESVEEVAARIERASDLLGRERLLLHPDCGFATFADNPICSAQLAEQKLAAVVAARERVRV